MTRIATYVSVWDDGIQIRSNCRFDETSRTVYDVESVDVDGMGLDVCSDEYIELDDLEGTQIRNFKMED
jgi:hypothetical protein